MRALAALAWTSCMIGCGSSTEEPREWVQDFEVSQSDYTPVPQTLSAPAGSAIDLIVSFRPGTPRTSSLSDRQVRKPNEWRLRAEVLDSGGTQTAVEPIVSLYGELHPFDRRGSEVLNVVGVTDRDAKELLWQSPKPPSATDEKRYLWGHVQIPSEPGDHRLVVRLYPTADPHRDGELNPELGAPVDLYEVPLFVTETQETRTRVSSRLTYHAKQEKAPSRYQATAAGGAR